jgi:cytosine/adenosine deaminase-related metal-dependent hydrolase
MIDTLIKNAMVITVDLQRRVFMNGAIVIHDGNILEVGPSDPVAPVTRPPRSSTRPGNDPIPSW